MSCSRFKFFLRPYTTHMSFTVSIAHQKVPVKGCSSTEEFNKVLAFQPFQDWLHSFSQQQTTRNNEMNVKSIELQNIDYFGSEKIGFIKFKSNVCYKETEKNIPGIVFMVKKHGHLVSMKRIKLFP